MAVVPTPPNFLDFLQDFRIGELAPHERSAIEELFDQLHAHEREETETLSEYQYAATKTSDAGVKFLMQLVIDDERKHHELMQAMADDVKQSLQWLADKPPLPSITATGEERERLLAQTRHFLQMEQNGVGQLEDLHSRVRDLKSGLLELILQLMLIDTRKHVEVLRYIERRLQERI